MKFFQTILLFTLLVFGSFNIVLGQSTGAPVKSDPSLLIDSLIAPLRPVQTQQFNGDPNQEEE